MKIILSRKGFDSSIQGGGKANFIFKDKPYMIPIPEVGTGIKYEDLRFNGESLLKTMRDLKINQYTECHLDPFLTREGAPEATKDWKFNLGQVDRAQSILSAKDSKVEVGDIFLFFGWFQKLEYDSEKNIYKYSKLDGYHPEGVHLIYGYLQIGEIIDLTNKKNIPNWAKNHPHVVQRDYYKESYTDNNTIYVASEKLMDSELSGAGILNFNDELILTRRGTFLDSKGKTSYFTRTKWELPEAFLGSKIKGMNSGKEIDSRFLKSAPRGQEFIVINDPKLRLKNWTNNILKKHNSI